jgi:hypothetical protein
VALRTFVDDSSMLFSLTVQTARSTLWSIIEWSHFNFISCLRQLFYGTQIDDLFRFVINQLSRRDSICIYFFFLGSFLFFFWAGKTFWRTGFLAEILQLEIRVLDFIYPLSVWSGHMMSILLILLSFPFFPE